MDVYFPSGQILSEWVSSWDGDRAGAAGLSHPQDYPPVHKFHLWVLRSPASRQRYTGTSGWRREASSGHLRPACTSGGGGAGRSRDLGHAAPAAGIKGTPRRGRDFRHYPLRQDGRWPGVGRRKEEEEGGNSHLPAAVPAEWEAAGGRRDRESVRSKQPAVCNTQPRRHCSLAGSLGELPDPLRWPLALWAGRG